jgi:hypothetical protein
MAWAVKLGYDFKGLGLPGFSTYARYSVYDTPDPGEENFSQDYTETELSARYEFDGGLKGLSTELSWGWCEKDQDQREDYPAYLQKLNEDITDFRFYLTYDF